MQSIPSFSIVTTVFKKEKEIPIFLEAMLNQNYNGRWEVIVLILQRKNDIILSPNATEVIRSEDVLVVSGSWDKLEQLFTHIQHPPEKQ